VNVVTFTCQGCERVVRCDVDGEAERVVHKCDTVMMTLRGPDWPEHLRIALWVGEGRQRAGDRI